MLCCCAACESQTVPKSRIYCESQTLSAILFVLKQAMHAGARRREQSRQHSSGVTARQLWPPPTKRPKRLLQLWPPSTKLPVLPKQRLSGCSNRLLSSNRLASATQPKRPSSRLTSKNHATDAAPCLLCCAVPSDRLDTAKTILQQAHCWGLC